MENSEKVLNKIKKIAHKRLNLVNVLKLFNIFLKLGKEQSFNYIEEFIMEYYGLEEVMPKDFYELILNKIHGNDYLSFFDVLGLRNIYILISYLKYNQEDINELQDTITPLQYYTIPKKHINKIVEYLKRLEVKDDNDLSLAVKDEAIWLLKRIPHFSENEYICLAYKIYLSIGFNNGLELLSGKYGEIDYEKVYFLFSRLNVKKEINNELFNNFLFGNKKDFNNVIRQMLNGEFNELFLNFDYFYNNFDYFVCKLGTKMGKNKVNILLGDRYLTHNVSIPEITGDILDDMLSSYYCKYDFLDTPEDEIHRKNFSIYNEYLRNKYRSSIPMIDFERKGQFLCEIISLSDPKNLVLGYRSGNCFRINGDASVLFHNFLQSEHMRLLSISTLENKDFAMMLIMRNGNVLIGQGIEVSKRAPLNIRGKKLYDTCREVLKELMEYMNSNGDDIVATIIGSSNSNVSEYNNQVLPFLINPILVNSNNYYNGIYNYQCLLDLSEGRGLQDIKLYIPSVRYYDKRPPILRRIRGGYIDDDSYMEFEKKLISLRFFRGQKEGFFDLYQKLLIHNELYTCCNKDWYITVFDDGLIDGFVLEGDERAKEEYDIELEKIQHSKLENMIKRESKFRRKKIKSK